MIIDTHCHLYAEEFEGDLEKMIERATDAGVCKFYLPAIDSTTTDAMLSLEKKYPEKCFAMAGLHPCSVKADYKDELMKIEALLAQRSFAAIGETGLDFHWDKTFVKEQYLSLEMHAGWALQYNRPLVLHTRDAMQDTIDVIKKFSGTNLKGIFHCFGGSVAEAMQIIEAGFYLGIGGVVTYKNSGLSDVLKQVTLHNLVLETDAPYLSPVPFRGKRNESSYLTYISEKVAEIMKIPRAEVEATTTANAEKLFA